MTELARDLYLLAAVFGLALVVAHAGMPVLAQGAFAAVGGVGALQLERAGLPIGSAVLLAVLGGAVAGAATGALVARADSPAIALAPGRCPGSSTRRCSRSRAWRAASRG